MFDITHRDAVFVIQFLAHHFFLRHNGMFMRGVVQSECSKWTGMKHEKERMELKHACY